MRFRQRRLLELGTDQAAEPPGVTVGIEPQHADPSGIGLAESLEDLHGGGLPGAVRAEDAEDLALGDLERDVPHRHGVAVALGQVLDLDDGCPGRSSGPGTGLLEHRR